MALSHLEPRLALIGNSFVQVGAALDGAKRSRSYSGYIPYALLESPDRPRLVAEGCATVPASPTKEFSDDSTGASESQEGPEALSSPRLSEREQSGSDEESEESEEPVVPKELWPDTDSDNEDYDWTPCNRRRRMPTPTFVPAESAENAQGGRPDDALAALATLLPQILATQPAAGFVAPLVGGGMFHAPPPLAAAPMDPAMQGSPATSPPPPPPKAPPILLGAPVLSPQHPPTVQSAPLAPAQFLGPPEPPAQLAGTPAAPFLLPLANALPMPWAASPLGAQAAGASPRCSAERMRSTMLAAEAALAALEAAEEEAAVACSHTPDSTREAALACSDTPAPTREVTSLMLRNLPSKLTQRELLDEIHASGFEGRCDFCYMPRDFNSGENRGHAFVNFASVEATAEFRGAWHKQRRFDVGPSQPGINISVATLQGLAANVSKWDNPRMRRVRNPEYKPFVLEHAAEGSGSSGKGQ